MPALYETNADIPSFAGLNTSGDGYNMSMRYATEAENVDTTGGGFAPMRKGRMLEQAIGSRIGTLAVLHRRFNTDEDKQDVMVAIGGGKVYTKLLDHDDPWVVRHTGLSEDSFSCVTYEINPEDSTASVDVLLFTNNKDGMFMLRGDDLSVSTVPTPYKFNAICRSNERIWGTGVSSDPDLLCYSAPYDPLDWSTNEEIPADGGGEIRQPSWDGDSFIGLHTYGSSLLAFKKDSIWRVSGTNPGDYYFREQYGHGTVEADTIAVNQSNVYMMGWDGIIRYDGDSGKPFQQDTTSGILRERLNYKARSQMCGAFLGNKYLIAFPMDGAAYNNAILQYNPSEQTFLLRTGINVSSFMSFHGRLFYTSGIAPGYVFELDGTGECLPVKWVTGYQDLGMKGSVKSAFTLYFTCEAEAKFPLNIGIRTEKKLKSKQLTITPGKSYRTNINVSGRYFRLELNSDAEIPFRINGGIRMHMELDPD